MCKGEWVFCAEPMTIWHTWNNHWIPRSDSFVTYDCPVQWPLQIPIQNDKTWNGNFNTRLIGNKFIDSYKPLKPTIHEILQTAHSFCLNVTTHVWSTLNTWYRCEWTTYMFSLYSHIWLYNFCLRYMWWNDEAIRVSPHRSWTACYTVKCYTCDHPFAKKELPTYKA